MGFINKWIANFLEKKVILLTKKEQQQALPSQINHNIKQLKNTNSSEHTESEHSTKSDYLKISAKEKADLLLILCRERMTLSKNSRNFLQSMFFKQVIVNLDRLGRRRAADQLLSDALFIYPNIKLKMQLSTRLIEHGQRMQAKYLLLDLSTYKQYAFYAFKNLAIIHASKGRNEEAIIYYERALAVDFSDQNLKDTLADLKNMSSKTKQYSAQQPSF